MTLEQSIKQLSARADQLWNDYNEDISAGHSGWYILQRIQGLERAIDELLDDLSLEEIKEVLS